MDHKQEPNGFGKLLGNGNNVSLLKETVKTLLGLQKSHTLPALWLAMIENLPKRDTLRHYQMGEKLKQELKIILGTSLYVEI